MKKYKKLTLIGIFFLSTSVIYSSDKDHAGTLVRVQGKVDLFYNPLNEPTGDPPRVLYKDVYYSTISGKLGQKLYKNNIIRTAPNAKAKIIYRNGDQIDIGSATSYQVIWRERKKENQDSKNKKSTSIIKLFYGKIRSIIAKDGPRKNMQVRSRGVAMGVRGTDFYVSSRGVNNDLKLSVLRGSVFVQSTNKKVKKSLRKAVIRPGLSAVIKAPLKYKKVDKSPIKVFKTTKKEIKVIREHSVIAVTKKAKKEAIAGSEETVARLEKQAIKATLNDIKDYNPKLYAKLKEKNIEDVAQIDKEVSEELISKAPEKPQKPFDFDLESYDEDLYEDYFNVE